MKHVVPGLLMLTLAAPSAGCLNTSEVELTLHVREEALAQVVDFPVRIIVDMGTSTNYELHVCEWESGFLETQIDVNTYDKCPEPLTLEAVMFPLTDACNAGAFQLTDDWHEEGTVLYGEGTLDIFVQGFCNTTERRTLRVDAVAAPN